MKPSGVDIYCKVVDNYGDIGVCWRLARQLARQVPLVRLWVDDLHSFAHINPEISPHSPSQTSQGVQVEHWHNQRAFPEPLDLLIEAFACELPDAVQAAAARLQVVWLNLEYLSAESWVGSFHGLPSPQANGANKYFFFPGFTPDTGGLLREAPLMAERQALQSDSSAQLDFLSRMGLQAAQLEQLAQAQMRLVFLFSYPNAPVHALLRALESKNTLLMIPRSVARHHSLPHSKNVQLHLLDYVSQDDFDRLLWCSHLNIVRGEDSLVRALWAARPMVWQPYVQEEHAHLDKLQAWLAHSAYSPELQRLHHSWSQGESAQSEQLLSQLLSSPNWEKWQLEATNFSEKLASGPELSDAILTFYTQVARTR